MVSSRVFVIQNETYHHQRNDEWRNNDQGEARGVAVKKVTFDQGSCDAQRVSAQVITRFYGTDPLTISEGNQGADEDDVQTRDNGIVHDDRAYFPLLLLSCGG